MLPQVITKNIMKRCMANGKYSVSRMFFYLTYQIKIASNEL